MDILSELEQLKADYASAQALIEQAKASNTALETIVAEKDEDISKARKAVVEAQAALADKDIALATLQAQFEELKASQKSAQERAIDMVASQGVKPVKVDVKAQESPKMTQAEALAKYAAITNSKERGAFYAAHRDILFDK